MNWYHQSLSVLLRNYSHIFNLINKLMLIQCWYFKCNVGISPAWLFFFLTWMKIVLMHSISFRNNFLCGGIPRLFFILLTDKEQRIFLRILEEQPNSCFGSFNAVKPRLKYFNFKLLFINPRTIANKLITLFKPSISIIYIYLESTI